MVTPRVETSPDRSDFAKLGETEQFADDIRSQVAEKSRELNFADTLLARGDCNCAAFLHRGKAQIIDGTGSLEAGAGILLSLTGLLRLAPPTAGAPDVCGSIAKYYLRTARPWYLHNSTWDRTMPRLYPIF